MLLPRSALVNQIRHSMRIYPVTALIGPRQCGKTTLARQIAGAGEYFDLEDPISERRLAEPAMALRPLRGIVVIDEIQRHAQLFPLLRVLADRKPLPARFLVLGSASPELLRQASESLAGRISFVKMSGFSLEEAGFSNLRRLWLRGGFPRSFLARSNGDSYDWRQNFIRTFLERDIREFGVQIPPAALRRLWMMLAHYHAQLWSGSEIARSLGEAHTTVKRHLDVLSAALMVRQLQPWYQNMGKRQVKSPKVYVRDSGLMHALLGLDSFRALEGHPKLGASWEGFVIEEAIRIAGERNCYFWATQSGAELDLLILSGRRRIGVEIKYADAPGLTKSMRIATEDLQLDELLIVYPGEASYRLDLTSRAIPLKELRTSLKIGAQVVR
jgi:predicted AAA+ superfamily ATPase